MTIETLANDLATKTDHHSIGRGIPSQRGSATSGSPDDDLGGADRGRASVPVLEPRIAVTETDEEDLVPGEIQKSRLA